LPVERYYVFYKIIQVLKKIKIQPIDYGRWTTATNLCGQKIKFKPFALLLYFLVFLLGKIDKNITNSPRVDLLFQ
jgi:hypothetical protein